MHNELTTADRVACPHCGRASELAGALASAHCACGAPHRFAYDYERDAVSLAADQTGTLATERNLRRRIDVLESNLEALDPLSRWQRVPQLDWKLPAILAGAGFVLQAAGLDMGILLILAGAVVGVVRWQRYQPANEQYVADMATSGRNAASAQSLRRQLGLYSALLQHTHAQDHAR
jgi:hypothetical protein